MDLSDRRTEYEAAGIDLADTHEDPITQFERWFTEAEAAGVYEPTAMVLSTVAPDGMPSGRYVLLRGVDQRGFAFFTNYDSDKAVDLAASAKAALTFGWLQLHRQVRVTGTVSMTSTAESDRYFATRPRGSQIGAWASPQSRVLADRAALEALVADQEAHHGEEVIGRPPNWGGYRVAHDTVEFWQGRPSRLHDRIRYRRDPATAAWIRERLAP
jgi:pyridoxamine 5'-phosphate oxidase